MTLDPARYPRVCCVCKRPLGNKFVIVDRPTSYDVGRLACRKCGEAYEPSAKFQGSGVRVIKSTKAFS
jgi:hypothetical protein